MRLFKRNTCESHFKCTLHASVWKWKEVDLTAIPSQNKSKPDEQQEAKRRKAANIHSLTPNTVSLWWTEELLVFLQAGIKSKESYNSNANFWKCLHPIHKWIFLFKIFLKRKNEFLKSKTHFTFILSLEVISPHLPLFTKPDFWLVFGIAIYLF